MGAWLGRLLYSSLTVARWRICELPLPFSVPASISTQVGQEHGCCRAASCLEPNGWFPSPEFWQMEGMLQNGKVLFSMIPPEREFAEYSHSVERVPVWELLASNFPKGDKP